ncbi:hypothetical protein HK27_04360 [Acetobacter orientalis]|nr:hypothetical protein HK27_04360 [Acetobacter orientalis]
MSGKCNPRMLLEKEKKPSFAVVSIGDVPADQQAKCLWSGYRVVKFLSIQIGKRQRLVFQEGARGRFLPLASSA